MGWWNRNEYPVEKIRQWIADGKTQQWIGDQLQVSPKLIYKVCKKHGIQCQRTGPRAGVGHPCWKGGVLIDQDGYRLVYCPGHPAAREPRKKYVLEHRLVMERHLGRYLTEKEVVHHKNKDKTDNRVENLILYSQNSDHLREELNGRIPNWTEDGKRRIREGLEKAAEMIRLRSKPNGTSNTQTTNRQTTPPDTDHQPASETVGEP